MRHKNSVLVARTRFISFAAVLIVGAAGCGNGDDDQSTPTSNTGEVSTSATVAEPSEPEPSEPEPSEPEPSEPEPSEPEPSEPEPSEPEPSEPEGDDGLVAGCGEEAITDLTDLSVDRPVARCEPGAPAPIPLAERVQLTIGVPAPLEAGAPLLLAEALGEFDKENLDVEIQVLPNAEQVVQIAAGRLDAGFIGFEPLMYTQFDEGLGIKTVFGLYKTPQDDPSVPQVGFWARADQFSDPQNPDIAELNGTTWAQNSATPPAAVAAYAPSWTADGLDLSSLSWTVLAFADIPAALINGAVVAGNVTTPFWYALAEDPGMILLAPSPPQTPAGYIFGQRLLEDEPEVGRAVVRAMIRTINTYLSPTFKTDSPEIVAALAEAIGVTTEQLESTPTFVYDWEIRAGSLDVIQDGYRILGVLERETNVPESDLIDRSFVEAALRGE